MPIDQFQTILDFSIRVFTIIAITCGGIKLSRILARPRGTYGAGLPERRRRPRLVLQHPDRVAERLREVPASVAA